MSIGCAANEADCSRACASTESVAYTDSTAITQAVLDYVEGWYSADSERMERALSDHLAKRRIQSDGEMMAVSKEWMVKATGDEWGKIEHPEQGRKDVSILAKTDTMASVMLVSDQYVDYIHLAKAEGQWKVVNVIWDYLPEE